jgi:hypothetical protein
MVPALCSQGLRSLSGTAGRPGADNASPVPVPDHNAISKKTALAIPIRPMHASKTTGLRSIQETRAAVLAH